jgi:hypothetical protein
MSEQPDFAEFLRRIRCGDPEAAKEFVRRYESTIRLGLTDADDEEPTDA